MNMTTAKRAYNQALAFAFMAENRRREPFALARIGNDEFEMLPAAFGNIAFACELFEKAILMALESQESPGPIYEHSLTVLYDRLPVEIRQRIENEIVLADLSKKTFRERLDDSSSAFQKLRYAYEHNTLKIDIHFLSGFECVLYRIARELIV